MKKIMKIILMFSILIMSIFILKYLFEFGLISYIKYERNNLEKIDVSFLNNTEKDELIEIGSLLIDNNIYNAEVLNNNIQYYDLNHNIVSLDQTLSSKVEKIFEKYNIKYLNSNEDNKGNIIGIGISFFNKKFNYNYSFNEHKYVEGEIVFYSFRVEKVIDNHWYILRLCTNRLMCPGLE